VLGSGARIHARSRPQQDLQHPALSRTVQGHLVFSECQSLPLIVVFGNVGLYLTLPLLNDGSETSLVVRLTYFLEPPSLETKIISMDSEHIESIRQNNFGIMLISLIEDYEQRFSSAYESAGFGDVRRPHGYVLRYLEKDGSCITDIAQRAGITKQTAGKIVQELVRLRYVEVGSVAGDARVRLVRFSKRGRQLVDISQQLVQRLHDDYAEQVGGATFARFEETLQLLVKQLECAIPQLGGEDWPAVNPFFHFGRFMVEIAEDFERRLRAHLSGAGFDGIKPSYLAVLFHLDLEGSRLTALAQRVAVTPQAASLTINEMLRAKIIAQVVDPSDQRARLILLTPQGAALMEAIAIAAEAIIEEYAALVGSAAVMRLRDCLLKILRRLRISVFV